MKGWMEMIILKCGSEYGDIEDLIINGLCTDGGHHKQWYLEQIAFVLGIDLKKCDGTEDEFEPGIAP